jgi:oligopeptide transport system substrate-binding protein
MKPDQASKFEWWCRPGVCFAASLLVLSLVGCGKRETRVEIGDREQILHKGNGTEPAELDPQIVTGVTEHHTIMSLMEGLVTEDPHDLHPVPGVAERWDISPDGKVFTFHLRKNAKW